MKTTNKYVLSVRKSNEDIDIQKYLEMSEKCNKVINLSGRNSIKYNKSLRRRKKIENILESALKKVAIILVIILGVQIVSASMTNEVEEVKKELLKERVPEVSKTIELPEITGNTVELPVVDPDEQVIENSLCENLAFTNKERFEKECNTEKIKDSIQEVVELQKPRLSPVKQVEKPFDLDKLAYAVAMQETKNCTLGYGATHNNCFGIKHGNTVPCPGVPKMAMCKFNTPEESYEAFKTIWKKWYGGLPNREMAVRWSGNDRADIWKYNVLYFYNK